jgi:hypothetical protein
MKTFSLALAIARQPLLGERVWCTGPVAIISYEDNKEEWHPACRGSLLPPLHLCRPGDRM